MKNVLFLAVLAMTISAAPLHAAEGKDKHAEAAATSGPSKEDREKMAAVHEKMAACLRSDTDIKECNKELKKECEATMGEHCPWHKGKHKGKGDKHPS